MQNQTFIIAYLITLLLCSVFTVGTVQLLSPGLRSFFQIFTGDPGSASFFTRLSKVILICCGLTGALTNGYTTTEKANWLTLSWDMTDQLKATIDNLWPVLLTMVVVLIVTRLIDKHWNK